MHPTRTFALAALVLTAVVSLPAAAQRNRDRDNTGDRTGDLQRERTFVWEGTIPRGRRLLIKNINGKVDVERSTSGQVQVTGTKNWRRGDPEMVRIDRVTSGDDVVICALWAESSRCTIDGITNERNVRWNDRNDVSVTFVVRVPDGVRVDLETVNGGIEVRDVASEVIAETVNGSIVARSTGGPVRAETVNGSIDVSMGTVGDGADLQYETVNGSITLELPANVSAQLDLSTVNGRITTEFPVTVSGTLSPRKLRGTLGDGRMRLAASTVNGSVTLRKR
jgi:hypothetical protein